MSFEPTLERLEAYLRKYVVLTTDQATLVAIWVACTHVIEAFDCLGYLHITSASKRCGKTRLLEALEGVVAKPWLTGRTSAAALMRKVDAMHPTLLLDESDAAFNGDSDYAETLRGLLNSGYRRSGKYTVCTGQGGNLSATDFDTFCAKAIAGIGELPSTVSDRSLPIVLKRRTDREPVARFRARDAEQETRPILEALQVWAQEVKDLLHQARPALPSALNDRAQDSCEPLFAVADFAGPTWAARTRQAAVQILSETSESEDVHIDLLHDIYTIFNKDAHADAPFIGTGALVEQLVAMEDKPWADWKRGKPITARAVAARLRLFDIFPRSNGKERGYDRDRFSDAWERYNPSMYQSPNENGHKVPKTTRQATDLLDGLKTAVSPINTGAEDTLTG